MSLFAKLTSTTLKSLKFGQTGTEGDSTAPYIVTNINNSTSYLKSRYSLGLGNDSLTIRGNKTGARYASAVDTVRISKFLIDPLKGPFFLYNQIGLQKSNPLIGQLNPRYYIPSDPETKKISDSMRLYNKRGANTLAQIPKTAYGGHIQRHGNIFSSTPETYNQIINFQNRDGEGYERNKLYRYYINFFNAKDEIKNNIKYASDKTIIDEYDGGPNSTYGIGSTILRRSVYSGELDKINKNLDKSKKKLSLNYDDDIFYKNYYNNNIEDDPTRFNITKKDKEYKTIQDSFEKEIKNSNNITPVSQSTSPTYVNYQGNSNKTTGKEVELLNEKYKKNNVFYNQSLKYNRSTSPLDNSDKQEGSSEGIKVIFNQVDPFIGEYIDGRKIEFSSYIKGYNENHSSNWNEIKYNGRSEFLYNFISYKKTVSFDLQIPIFRVEDLKPTHNKLKALQKGLAGKYKENRLGGIITYISLGYYLNDQACIINSLNIKIPDEASWDWGVPQEDNSFLAYSTLLEASFNITTIGDENGGIIAFNSNEGVGYDDKLKDDLFKSTLPDLTGIGIIQR